MNGIAAGVSRRAGDADAERRRPEPRSGRRRHVYCAPAITFCNMKSAGAFGLLWTNATIRPKVMDRSPVGMTIELKTSTAGRSS
jgi:hypothetical protein